MCLPVRGYEGCNCISPPPLISRCLLPFIHNPSSTFSLRVSFTFYLHAITSEVYRRPQSSKALDECCDEILGIARGHDTNRLLVLIQLTGSLASTGRKCSKIVSCNQM